MWRSIMKKLVMLGAILFFCLFFVFAGEDLVTLLPSLSESDWARLEQGESIDCSTLDGGTIKQVAPLGSIAYERAVQAEKASSGFAVASVVLIPYPASWKKENEQQRQLDIFNTIRKVSTQKGITYISHRWGDRPRPLFSESYYVSDPENPDSKIADPVTSTFPLSMSSYAYQDDSAFSGNVYKHTYTNSAKEIFLDVTNYSPMKYQGITCLKSGQLSLCMDTYQLEQGLLVYSMAVVTNRKPQIRILFLTVDLPSSFMRRVVSLRNWFKAQVSLN